MTCRIYPMICMVLKRVIQGDQTEKATFVFLMWSRSISVVLMCYLSRSPRVRSIQQKMWLMLKMFKNEFEGFSCFQRMLWIFVLYLEIGVKLATITLSIVISVQSTTMVGWVEVLGNSIGLIVLAELNIMSSNYILV